MISKSSEIKISIITASYNYARYISETIESVIKQSYQNWEMIIVDDGSKDNSIEIIKSYCQKDSRIKLYTHKNNKNKGLSKTLQLGIKHASNEWIAFLESDDVFTPQYLEEKVKIIRETPDAEFIFNDYKAIGDESFGEESHHKIFQKNMKSRIGLSDYKKDFCPQNPVPTFSVVMLKKELLKGLNYNTPIMPYLDWFLWGQIASKKEFYYTDKPLTCWRKHPQSFINKNRKFLTFYFFFKLGMYLPDIYKRKLRRLKLIPVILNI